jgi:DNA polymerase-3 subunit beta
LLRRSLSQTTFAAVKESTTGAVHYTNGVFLSFKSGRLDMVATDGHRLALKRNDGLGGAGAPEQDLLLPARVADELEKMLPDDEDTAVELFHLGSQVCFRFGSMLVASALLDVKFPPYESVIPRDIESKVYLRRDELGDALGRVELLNRQKDQNPVALLETQSGALTVSSEAGEVGKGSEELTAELSGPDVKVRVNPRYITDVLKVLGGEQVTLNWVSQVNPVMITSPREPDFLYIVMPIRMD